MTNNTLYWMWIQQAVGQGSSAVPKLLDAFSSPEEVHRADRLELQRAGVTGKALDCLCRKSLDGVNRLAERSQKLGWILTPEEDAYPDLLRQIFSPPLVLYGKGRMPDFDTVSAPPIAMVGTRGCTAYGEKVAGGIAAGLASVGCVIVSGGAKGIDRAAHEGALYAGGCTVAVQACGLDVPYPQINSRLRAAIVEQGGAVITEYTPGLPAYRNHFKVRNRLLSALSWGVCIVEAPKISGALITARTAVEQDRDVFVIPGNITSQASYGSNELIKHGALMVTRAGEILQSYQARCGVLPEAEADRAQEAYFAFHEHGGELPLENDVPQTQAEEPTVSCPDSASAEARQVYEHLTAQPMTAEELCVRTGIPVGTLFASLTELELIGCVRSYPGKRYSR